VTWQVAGVSLAFLVDGRPEPSALKGALREAGTEVVLIELGAPSDAFRSAEFSLMVGWSNWPLIAS
jgi:hypothetical protein